MTTITFSLVALEKGRRQISKFRYSGPSKDVQRVDVSFPSFGAGLNEIAAFYTWARENKLLVREPDHVTYVVACKQKHLFEFWKRCYGPEVINAADSLVIGDKVLRTMHETTIRVALDLRRALESLDSRKLYALIAYEY